jgi:16S rRNA (guanine527-N7)-methyltransferase
MQPEAIAEVSASSWPTSRASAITLEGGLEAIGLDLPPERVEALKGFLDLLQRWNRVYNLTAVRDPQEMLVQHLLDALAVIPILGRLVTGDPPAHCGSTADPIRALEGLHVADIGSGAGIPGLVLAIVCPKLHLLSIEPVGKKCAFQQQVASELALAHVTVKQSRAEQVTAPSDWVMCRALTTLAEFIRISAGLMTPATRLAALKGRRSEIDAELRALPAGWQAEVIPVVVPGLAAERHLVVLQST